MGFRKDPHTGRKVAVGAALAGAVGYLTGILTAPKSGQETRADIADKADVLKDDAGRQLEIAQDELAVVIKQAQEKTMTLGAKAQEEFNEALIRAKAAQIKTKGVLKAVKAGESDDPELNKAVKQAKQAAKNLGRYLKN